MILLFAPSLAALAFMAVTVTIDRLSPRLGEK